LQKLYHPVHHILILELKTAVDPKQPGDSASEEGWAGGVGNHGLEDALFNLEVSGKGGEELVDGV
jgi:hypothetical protein